MDAKTRRVMKAKQGKAVSGSGDIGQAEGYEGQVQVRDTKDGPMLFAKLKGEWIKSPLSIGGTKAFFPKALIVDVILPSTGNTAIYTIPKFISIPDILLLSIMGKIASATATYYTQFPVTEQLLTVLSTPMMLVMKTKTRQVFLANKFLESSTSWGGKDAKLTILYK